MKPNIDYHLKKLVILFKKLIQLKKEKERKKGKGVDLRHSPLMRGFLDRHCSRIEHPTR